MTHPLRTRYLKRSLLPYMWRSYVHTPMHSRRRCRAPLLASPPPSILPSCPPPYPPHPALLPSSVTLSSVPTCSSITNGRCGLMRFHRFVFGLGVQVQPVSPRGAPQSRYNRYTLPSNPPGAVALLLVTNVTCVASITAVTLPRGVALLPPCRYNRYSRYSRRTAPPLPLQSLRPSQPL